jgi:DMSO reductase anchor subunit
MHPAFSVIFFTTASGAGYGLLALLGLFVAAGQLPADRSLAFFGPGIALALITAGLLSSALHLGHPERAWRAFSQWRSSWLSREGVASVVTYVPAGLFSLGWLVLGRNDGAVAWAGLAAAICALATLATTGMIYASLKPIPQWSSRYTLPAYLIYGIMSGSVLLQALLAIWTGPARAIAALALAAIVIGWIWKNLTWRHNDALSPRVTANSATGLKGGQVRSIEWPHTEENYVLKEMGYAIARKHAAKLRLFVQIFAFAIPLILTLAVLFGGRAPAITAALLAVLSQGAGLLVERWLFFAEAKHVVTTYYGR